MQKRSILCSIFLARGKSISRSMRIYVALGMSLVTLNIPGVTLTSFVPHKRSVGHGAEALVHMRIPS